MKEGNFLGSIPGEDVHIAHLKLLHHVLEWRQARGYMFWLIRKRFEESFLVLLSVESYYKGFG